MHLGAAGAITKLAPSLRDQVYGQIREDWTPEELVLECAKNPITLPVLRGMVRLWKRALDSAPWDLDDGTLAPAGAGACSACPYRSGAQPDLWDPTTDRCTDEPCWTERTAAYWARRLEAGVRLAPKEDKPALLQGYVRCDDAWLSPAQIGARAEGVEPALQVQTDGTYAEVFYREEVAKALETQGELDLARQVRARRPYDSADDAERRARDAETRRRADAEQDARVTAALEAAARHPHLHELLADHVLRRVAGAHVLQSMLRRRGLPDRKAEERVPTLMESAPLDLEAVILELAIYTALLYCDTPWLEAFEAATGAPLRATTRPPADDDTTDDTDDEE
jgi:hypothetical protein